MGKIEKTNKVEKTDKIKIAIVDDHQLLRAGLKVLLDEIEGVEVVIEASNGSEFIKQIGNIKPDLALVDINMPVMGGEETVRRVKNIIPNLKIIILSMFSDELYFNTMNELGVDGYIIKESDYDELERAISAVMKGGKYFSQQLLVNLLHDRTLSAQIQLTEREKEILRLLCLGFSTSEIADKLNLSARTVEKHRADMLVRTNSSNSISLVVYAIKNRLVEI
jgi:DNA-binding NarL/FixJ family response regulator